MHRKLLIGIAIALLPFSFSTGHAANIVQNGNFESRFDDWRPNVSNTTLGYDYNGLNHVFHSGQFAADFSVADRGVSHTLEQILATTAGTTYDISFWANSPRPDLNNAPVCVSFGGANAFCSTTPYSDYTERQWTQYSGQATATSDSTLLKFTVGPVPGEVYLDDVSVTPVALSPVPLPAALPMFAIALLGLAVVGARARTGVGARVS